MKMRAQAAKNRGDLATPEFKTIGQQMMQGGKQSHDVPHTLPEQMKQGGAAYSRPEPGPLRRNMGQ